MRATTGGSDRHAVTRPFESGIPGALPAEVDRFVGRRAELDTLQKLVRRHRLVTIVGPAGVGKTRLAVRVVQRLPGSWAGRTAMIELDAIKDGDLVPRTVAIALGLPGQPGRTMTETVFGALRDAHTLLIMDNCEHIVDACARFADAALRACPGLRLLATSRESLNIQGEMVLGVTGLSLPPNIAATSRADLLRCDAVRLFAQRAREVSHDYELTEQNATDVAAVCAELDASPLAIELAARWLPMLSITNIRTRLHNRFDLLTTSRRTARDRQRSLREAIDWSYELLDDDERTVFRRLSVLVGTFDVEMALTVCADERLTGDRVLGLIARLQASSLIAPAAGPATLRLLESIRAYGRERLDAAGETDAVHDRLAGWLSTLAAPLISQPYWFPMENQRRLETLLGSLQAAMGWAESTDDERYPVLAIATARCWLHAGYLTEARKLLRSVLERATCRQEYRCSTLGYAGYLAVIQGEFHEGIQVLEEEVRFARSMNEPTWISQSLYTLGCVRQAAEQLTMAEECLTESLRVAGALGAPLAEAMVLDRLAWNAVLGGDLVAARSLDDRAMPVFRRSAPVHALGLVLHTAGTIALLTGELDDAERYFADSLRAAPTTWLDVPYHMEGLAMVAERGGRLERAVRLFSSAKTIRGSDQLFAEPIWRRHVEDSVAALWDVLGGDEVERLAAPARELGQEQAVRYALDDIWPSRTDTRSSTLDERERQVARLVANGLSNPQIAERLGLSLRTVAYRVRAIRDKTGLKSREEIRAWVAADPDREPAVDDAT